MGPPSLSRTHMGSSTRPMGLGRLSRVTVRTGTGFGYPEASRLCGYYKVRASRGGRIEPCLVSGMPPLYTMTPSPWQGEGVVVH